MDGPAATGPNAPAPAPAASGGDWRAHQDMEERRRMVNSIKKTLKKRMKKLMPVSVPVPESELQRIAQQYEENIYTAAKNESDYVLKITLKMQSMEKKMKEEQKKPPGNAQVIQNQRPPGPESVEGKLADGCKRHVKRARVATDAIAPGFPPRGDSSADGLCQGAPIPPQIHCSPQAVEAQVNHTTPVPVNGTPPIVAAPVLPSSPPPAPSSLANPAGSVSSGGDENLCLGELIFPDDLSLGFPMSDEPFNPDLIFPDDLSLGFPMSDEPFNPDEFFEGLDF